MLAAEIRRDVGHEDEDAGVPLGNCTEISALGSGRFERRFLLTNVAATWGCGAGQGNISMLPSAAALA
jgi:hypothetical protein